MFKTKFRLRKGNKNLPAEGIMVYGLWFMVYGFGLLNNIRIHSFFNANMQKYIFGEQQEKFLLSIIAPSELTYF